MTTIPTYNVDMTGPELVVIHNELALRTGDTEIKRWAKSKVKLVERLDSMVDQLDLEDEIEAFEEAAAEDLDAQEELGAAEEPEAQDEPEAQEEPTEKPITIRERALDLMCEVAYFEDKTKKSSDENRVEPNHKNARSVGLSYKHIVDVIREEFEGSQTTVACLRWYAVKVRGQEAGYEGYRLCQRRPRTSGKAK